MSPSNMSFCHIDYYELKVPKKQPVQGHPSSFLLQKAGTISHVKGTLPVLGGWKTSLSPETGN